MAAQSLVVVCGPPGVGKSTVAGAVADSLDATRLRTDVVRKDVAPDPDYTDEERRRVYDELFARAREPLAEGRSLVLDGTFQYRETRERAAELGAEVGADVQFLRVTCDEETVRRRLGARSGDPSDAVFENYRSIRRNFDPIERDHETVDNSQGIDRTRTQVREVFG